MAAKRRRSDYYDIPLNIEEILVDNGMVDELFYLKDIQQRKMYLDIPIAQETVIDIVRHILQFNKEDAGIPNNRRNPILLYIASNGGEVDPGFELIDVIMNSRTPVYTINLGYLYSMGTLVGLAGHKRFAFPNSKFLLHDGSNFIYNSGMKAQDQMKFQTNVEQRIKDYVLSRSYLTSEEYDKNLRVEWYMFADEAKDIGFIDYIIGEDCAIDEII